MIKQILIVVLIAILNNSTVIAQEITWKENGLTWDNFQGKPNMFVDYGSELYYALTYKAINEQIKDVKVKRLVAVAYIKPKLSWVKYDAKTAQNLRYNQVIFDIVEYNRRELQYTLNDYNNIFQTERILNQRNKVIQDMTAHFNKSTNNGQNDSLVIDFSNRLKEGLGGIEKSAIPLIKERNFSVGMPIGGGAMLLNGSSNKYFNNTTGTINIGMEFQRKKSSFLLNVAIGVGNKLKQDYNDKHQNLWAKGEKSDLTFSNFAYGYNFNLTKRHRLTPHLGLGIFEFKMKNPNDKNKPFTIVDYNLAVGLKHTFTYSRALNLSYNYNPFFPHNHEIHEFGISSFVYYMPYHINNEIKGTYIQVGLAINFMARLVHVSQ